MPTRMGSSFPTGPKIPPEILSCGSSLQLAPFSPLRGQFWEKWIAAGLSQTDAFIACKESEAACGNIVESVVCYFLLGSRAVADIEGERSSELNPATCLVCCH